MIVGPAAGAIKTQLQRHTSGWLKGVALHLAGAIIMGWKTPPQGASTTLTAALSPDLEAQPGVHNLFPVVWSSLVVWSAKCSTA